MRPHGDRDGACDRSHVCDRSNVYRANFFIVFEKHRLNDSYAI